MPTVIDLDAFAPESVTVSLAGVEVEIKPPRTKDILRIGVLSSKFNDVKENDLADLEVTFNELAEALKVCVPTLPIDDLNMVQLLKLVGIITDMATPKDIKELDARGITVAADPKAPSA